MPKPDPEVIDKLSEQIVALNDRFRIDRQLLFDEAGITMADYYSGYWKLWVERRAEEKLKA
jgi:hypothetical protein